MAFIDTFAALKNFILPPKTVIDNQINRLHYRCTTTLFMFGCVLVSLTQFFGKPIQCISNDEFNEAFTEKFINTYCWIQTTFSVRRSWNKTIGIDVPYPGIDKYSPLPMSTNDEIIYHSYYQWVGIFLFIQGLSFYLPHFIWKSKISKRMAKLISNLDELIVKDSTKHSKQLSLLSEYLIDYKSTRNNLYHWFLFTECFQLLNVLLQIYLINIFLGGYFIDYGPDFYHFLLDYNDLNNNGSINRINPMIKVFPRLTKCTFHMFGSSGSLERHDTMCLLPINIVNEKIYILLWFWLYLLSILSALILIYHLLLEFSHQLRQFSLSRKIHIFIDNSATTTTTTNDPNFGQFNLTFIENSFILDQWFLLNLLLKNIEPLNSYELLKSIQQSLKQRMNDEELQSFDLRNGTNDTQ